jgi:pimeloyl-ACP methyl ester carboxylesterase
VTISDYVSDIAVWVRAIREQTGASCLWLIGHSEGGLVSLAAAQEIGDVCGLLSRAGLTLTDVGDQGSLEADLKALLYALRRVLRHPLIRRIITDLHAEIGRTPSLEAAIRPFQRARRERINGLLDRAIARGELSPSVDRETAADFVAAPLYWRLAVVGGQADKHHIARLAHMLASALRADA